MLVLRTIRMLMIGGNGFIGMPLVRELIERGHDVGIFHRTADGSTSPRAMQIQRDRNRLRDHEEGL